ncbi:CPBP family intramembrane glutamic endopeptidase [Psychromonas aquimarina]|uniref:CPBP family intramembrane glutamic endopeptidase n=1 Tax=Psychromonas aquimarina TaxID=444919 RepID=UPI00041CB2F2|nr:CPBP family intramembrane glutamic endopeptidase [Psychromonas aquimarina]
MYKYLNNLIFYLLNLGNKSFFLGVYGLALLWMLFVSFIDYFFFAAAAEIPPVLSDSEFTRLAVSSLIEAPVWETLIFQTLIQRLLLQAYNNVCLSITVTACLFALIHLSNSIVNAVIIFGLGSALALSYEYVRMRAGERSAFIVVCVAHSLWNTLVLFIVPLVFTLLGIEAAGI